MKFLHKMKGGAALPPRASTFQMLAGLLGGLLSISIVAILTEMQHVPLLMAPLGATCVLLFAAPDAPLSQPRNVIGGHLLSSLVGLVCLKFVGTGPVEMGLAVGVAIVFMQFTRTLHAPAGADPLVIMMAGTATWSFLLTPVLVSCLILVMLALIINNSGAGRTWPRYWF